jgi:uncharacterized protein (DUF983 family)
LGKRNFVVNAVLCKCPRCQEGDLFVKPMQVAKPVDMPDHCPQCGQLYLPEPGFYYGAMFLSYILSGFFFLAVVGCCIIVLGMSVNASMLLLMGVAALTYLPLLRFSRSLWINLMVRYNPKAKEDYKSTSFGD